MLRRAPRVWVALGLCALGLALASTSSGSTKSARLTAPTVEHALLKTVWADGRIVPGAQCVGIGGVWSKQGQLSTHFACLVNAWHKPASVSAALWNRLGAALRSGNIALVYHLLGLPANPTRAQVDAASARVLGRVRPGAVGVDAIDATHVQLRPAPIATASFVPSVTVRRAMLAVVPAVEAYYYDHHTYVGVTSAQLAAAPYKTPVPAGVRIVSAKANSYCVEARAAGTTWSVHGPGGMPVLAACS